MAESTLVARVDEQTADDGTPEMVVCAPAVGVVDRLPGAGRYVNPLDRVCVLRVLGRRHEVILPRTTQGRVAEVLLAGTFCPVEHGQPLLRLRLGLEVEAEAAAARAIAAEGTAAHDLIEVTAPSEGIFYRKPSPDSPAYVEEGSPVKQGTVLGLVEVMKSFNQITYGGPDLPEQATVTRIQVEDGAEVAFGQVLMLVRA